MNEYEREIERYDYLAVLFRYKWFILPTRRPSRGPSAPTF